MTAISYLVINACYRQQRVSDSHNELNDERREKLPVNVFFLVSPKTEPMERTSSLLFKQRGLVLIHNMQGLSEVDADQADARLREGVVLQGNTFVLNEKTLVATGAYIKN